MPLYSILANFTCGPNLFGVHLTKVFRKLFQKSVTSVIFAPTVLKTKFIMTFS